MVWAVCSKVLGLLFFIHYLLLLRLFVVFGSCSVLVLLCSTLYPFQICNYLAGEERAGCMTFLVFSVLCGCYRSLILPYNAVSWSAVCHYGIGHTHLLFASCTIQPNFRMDETIATWFHQNDSFYVFYHHNELLWTTFSLIPLIILMNK